MSRSVTTASASLPQTILVSRLVESMPRIWTVSHLDGSALLQIDDGLGIHDLPPVPSPSP